MENTNMNKDDYFKYGYYTVDDQGTVFKSKREALELCTELNARPSWHYHDDFFSKINWAQEPSNNISRLYRDRARRLYLNRNNEKRFDHLVLCYSGGIDSHNMLLSFLSQGIAPDEIAVFYHSYDSKLGILSQEWEQQTEPRLNELLKIYPALKIRKIDLTELILTYLPKVIDTLPNIANSLPPNNELRGYLTEYVTDWKKLKDDGKSIRVLYGVDKPRVRYKDNKFIFNFIDYTGNSNHRPESDDCEWFYWGNNDDAANICIKQAHIVKKFWEGHMGDLKEQGCIYLDDLGWVLNESHPEVLKLIYPDCQGNDFKTWKPNHQLLGTRDYSLMISGEPIISEYMSRYRESISKIDPKFFNNESYYSGAIVSLSKDYIIN